ncbi:MAG: class I tRNA ligase family protein, partial [Candidatus Kerfeldbacteria bacterium]|nr:class I tRNA ligase family protein [Candidatus Kerfeldbacteria bacterium]
EKRGEGKHTVQYKLRDWVFSRQHYWGEPIPIIHCPEHGPVPVPEEQLPLELPYVEKYQPTGTGESPLASIPDWVNTTCPTCGKPAKRETDTMPNWAGSSWYFLRYCDPHNDTVFAYREKLDAWLPVDIYNGGMEHTTLHLLYSRFWYKFLSDEGLVPGTEPYRHRHSHGVVLASDSRKMSKSFGNVVNPDALVVQYGADALRLYELFMGPFEDAIPWSPQGIVGTRRFLDRVWALGQVLLKEKTGPATADVLRPLHQTIRNVGEDLEAFKFNTAVSSLMSCLNVFTDHPEQVDRTAFSTYLTVLAPFAPHLAEELWRMFGHEESIFRTSWPSYDSRIAADEEIEIAVQINGKVRGRIRVPAALPEEKVHARAVVLPNVARYLEGKTIRKRIYVPGRLVNFVV